MYEHVTAQLNWLPLTSMLGTTVLCHCFCCSASNVLFSAAVPDDISQFAAVNTATVGTSMGTQVSDAIAAANRDTIKAMDRNTQVLQSSLMRSVGLVVGSIVSLRAKDKGEFQNTLRELYEFTADLEGMFPQTGAAAKPAGEGPSAQTDAGAKPAGEGDS